MGVLSEVAFYPEVGAIIGMDAEVFPKREKLEEFQGFRQADIQVMRKFVRHGLEGLPAADA